MKRLWGLLASLAAMAMVFLLFVPVALGATVTSCSYSTPTTLPATGKISAFNKALVISYPKNNALVDGNKLPRPLTDTVSCVVYVPYGGSPASQKFVLVSNIYRISVTAGTYLLEPGEVSLTYDSAVSSSMGDQLAIWYSPEIYPVGPDMYNWMTAGSVNLGGKTESSKHTVTTSFQFPDTGKGCYAVFLAQRAYTEFDSLLSPVSWSSSAVLPMWAKGYVEPLPAERTDGFFGLLSPPPTLSPIMVNRLEFATMLVKGMGWPLTKKPTGTGDKMFDDTVATDTYLYSNDVADIQSTYFGPNYSSGPSFRIYNPLHTPGQYIETAARNGVITGYSNGTVRPANPITRQEAAVILARIANLKLEDDGDKVQDGLAAKFDDVDGIAPWAATAVLAAQKAGLIVGTTSSVPNSKKLMFKPTDNLTRAEAITLVYRVLKKMKKI